MSDELSRAWREARAVDGVKHAPCMSMVMVGDQMLAEIERLAEAVKAARYRTIAEGRISYRGYSYGMGSTDGITDLRLAIERNGHG